MTTLNDVALTCAKQLGRVDSTGTTITDLESEIKEEIGNAIKHFNRQSWHLTEFRQMQLTTASGTVWYSTVDLTSGDGDQSNTGRTAVDVNDIIDIIYMREHPGSSGLNEPMYKTDYRRFEMMQEGSTPAGAPEYYARYAGQIGVWPTPDAAYTIYLSGHVKPVVPTDGVAESVWFNQANELIEASALKRVCLKYLRDTQRASEFAAIEQEQIEVLTGERRKKTSTGRIKAHD